VRIEDKDEKVINYAQVDREHGGPRLVRDPVSGKTYEAVLDDFCCFDCYREVAVTTLEFEDATGNGPAERAAERAMKAVTDWSDPSCWKWSDRKFKFVDWVAMVACIIREEMSR
jgi:hypothetical protein